MPSGPLDLPDLTRKTILVVDDNDDDLELLSTLLKACRANVLLARNADTGLAYLSNVRLDLLITDLAMPGKDGIALIQTLRGSKGPNQTVAAIALTGFYEQYANARIHGFDVFLQKPVNPDTLSRTLKELLTL